MLTIDRPTPADGLAGLVAPILPALSTRLPAAPSQVTLLFTSYLVVTAVAILVTGWVSSRIGAENTRGREGRAPIAAG